MVETDEARATFVAEQRAPAATTDTIAQSARRVLNWDSTWLPRTWRWLSRGLVALIYAPAVALMLTGIIAAVGLFDGLWRLVRAFATHALDTVPATYDRLALAGHVAVVSGAFLAVVCALVVVAVGCRGRRWWHLYLIPSVPLSAVAALFFIFAVQWCMLAVSQLLLWPAIVWDILTAMALADAVLVAARVGGIGAGPLGTRRARLRERLRTGRAVSQTAGRTPARPTSRQTRPLPVVRFGPRITAVPVPDLPAASSASEAVAADAPTGEELSAAAEQTSVAGERQEGGAADASAL